MIAIVVVNSVRAASIATLTSLQRSRRLIQILFLSNSARILTCSSWTFQLVLILWIVFFIIAFRRWLLYALPPLLLLILLNWDLFNSRPASDFPDRVCCRIPADIFDSRWRLKWTWYVTDVIIWRCNALSSTSDRLRLFLLINRLSRILKRSYSFRNIIEVAKIDRIALSHCGLGSGSWLIFLHLRQFLLILLSKVSSYYSVTWAFIFKVATVIVSAYMLRLTIKDVLRSIFHKFSPSGQRLLLVFIKHRSYFMKRLSFGSVTIVSWWSSITPPFDNLLSTLILTNFGFKDGVKLWVIFQKSYVCRPLCRCLTELYLIITAEFV